MDSSSATETADLGSIPGRVKPKAVKLVFAVSMPDGQQQKGWAGGSWGQKPKDHFAIYWALAKVSSWMKMQVLLHLSLTVPSLMDTLA